MDPVQLFGFQFTFNFILYAVLAKWYVMPRITNRPLAAALMPLVWVHAFRSIGLTVLAPGAVDPALPMEFREMIAYGDMASGILALLSLLALRRGWSGALMVVWLFNIVGLLDLVNALIQGMRYDAFSFPLGASWLIVAFYVPALWVTSIMIFYLLLRKRSRNGA